MKKEDISGIVVYLVIIVLAVVFGLTVLQTHASESTLSGFPYVLYIIGAVLSGAIFNSILFELAHVLGAKIGKYDILSVNILGFCFYKSEGKTKFKFASFDGLTGETKIVPKKDMCDKANPYPYLFFGSLFFAVEAIAVMVSFSLLRDAAHPSGKDDLAFGLLTLGAIGFVILLYNILPIRVDAMTDGYRLTMVSNPKNKAAFNELLRVEHEIEIGNTDIEVKVFDEITNFTADLNLNRVYALLDQKKYQEAEAILDKIIDAKDSVSAKVHIRARAQKIFINLVTKTLDEAKEYYEKEVPVSERREISNDVSMASIRAYLLMSGLLDKSRSECIIALNNVYRAFKHTPKNRQETEVMLFNEALEKVTTAHPDWDLEGYKLEIKSKK
ncbi:MAG: hypothetical protein IJR08_04570 [Bacilli bacterium]|nr:hypothetical protein [Bacilli bacterium]